MLSVHELRKILRGKVPKTGHCDRCGKRRVLPNLMLCRSCGPKVRS